MKPRPFLSGPVRAALALSSRRVARVVPAYLVALVSITLISQRGRFADHPLQFLLLLHVSAQLRSELAPGGNSLWFGHHEGIRAGHDGRMAGARRPGLTRQFARWSVPAVAAVAALLDWVGGGSLVAGICADIGLVMGRPWPSRR